MTQQPSSPVPASRGDRVREWCAWEWKEILTPRAEVREILLEESDEGQRLRSSKPFAGIVTEAERAENMRRCPPPWPHLPYEPDEVPEERLAERATPFSRIAYDDGTIETSDHDLPGCEYPDLIESK